MKIDFECMYNCKICELFNFLRDVARELMECVATPSEDKQYEYISPQTFGKIRSALSSKHNGLYITLHCYK